MKFDGKDIAVLTASAIIGNYINEMFLLQGPDGSGFIPVNDGLGLDDLARGVTIAFVASALGRVF